MSREAPVPSNRRIAPSEISTGSLNVSVTWVGAVSSALGAPTNPLTNGIIDIAGGATLRYVGNGHSSDRVINITGNGASIDASNPVGLLSLSGGVTGAPFNLILTGTSPGAGLQSGVIATGTGTLTKNGTGTWTLGGINTFSGATAVNGGTLRLVAGTGCCAKPGTDTASIMLPMTLALRSDDSKKCMRFSSLANLG